MLLIPGVEAERAVRTVSRQRKALRAKQLNGRLKNFRAFSAKAVRFLGIVFGQISHANYAVFTERRKSNSENRRHALENVAAEQFDVNVNMAKNGEEYQPDVPGAEALDRIHDIIPGWEIPRLRVDRRFKRVRPFDRRHIPKIARIRIRRRNAIKTARSRIPIEAPENALAASTFTGPKFLEITSFAPVGSSSKTDNVALAPLDVFQVFDQNRFNRRLGKKRLDFRTIASRFAQNTFRFSTSTLPSPPRQACA